MDGVGRTQKGTTSLKGYLVRKDSGVFRHTLIRKHLYFCLSTSLKLRMVSAKER